MKQMIGRGWVPDLLAYSSARFPDREAVVAADKSISYRDLDARANRLVGLYDKLSLKPGDVVALLAKNEPEYFELQIAAMRSGIVFLPLNFRLAVPELEYILNDSDARVLVYSEEFAQAAEALDVADKLPLGEKYDTLLEAQEPVSASSLRLSADAPYAILYTSGTTGRPKGVLLSNRSLHARMSTNIYEYQKCSDDRFLQCLQLFHNGCINCLTYLQIGATNVIIRDFDPESALKIIAQQDISVVLLVPTMINMIINLPGVEDADFSNLRLVAYGGSSIPPVALGRAVELMGCGFLQIYGMTETNVITFLRPEDHDPVNKPKQLASAGTPALGMDMKVVDDNGRGIASGEVGELVCRGEAMMNGYLNLPDATAEAFEGGWMHTGDMGYVDDQGYLYITDRKKDMIVSGGENVYPREVEDVLYEHPDVLEAAVIGVPDEKWGERVHAVLVPRDGRELDADDIIAFVRSRIAGYKLPKSVEVVEQLPKTATGKIAKVELREARRDDKGTGR